LCITDSYVWLVIMICFYSVSAELGDHDPEVHTPGYISQFLFVQDQSEDIEVAIYEKFKTCK
jgi:hypothetical protein